jgi:hypothetical protein
MPCDERKIRTFLLHQDSRPGIAEFHRAQIRRLQAADFAVGGFRTRLVFECPGHWDRDLMWHSGQIWPERAQAEDFLREVRGERGA